MTRSILILTVLLLAPMATVHADEPPKSLPDVRSWRTATYDESFPLGKLAVTQTADGGVKIDVDAEPSVLKLISKATAVSASFKGTAAETTRDAAGNWIIQTK